MYWIKKIINKKLRHDQLCVDCRYKYYLIYLCFTQIFLCFLQIFPVIRQMWTNIISVRQFTLIVCRDWAGVGGWRGGGANYSNWALPGIYLWIEWAGLWRLHQGPRYKHPLNILLYLEDSEEGSGQWKWWLSRSQVQDQTCKRYLTIFKR